MSLISDQRTLSSTTHTSSKTKEALRNYVEATTAIVKTTQEGRKILIRDQGRRAGALCAYGEENTFIRQAKNAEAAKTLLTDAIVDYIKANDIPGNNVGRPIPFDFFSTTLVSPMFGKASSLLQKVKGLPSELQMVSEHNQALMMFNNQTMEININGIKYYVSPQVNHFNIPTNIDKSWLSDLVIDDKQDSLNSSSLNSYFNKMEDYFTNKSTLQKGVIDNIKGVTPEMRSKFNGIALTFNFLIDQVNNNPEIKELMQSLEIKQQSTIELPNKQKGSIAVANKALQDLLIKMKDDPQNSQLQSQYNFLSKSIERYHENINEDYKKIIKKRGELYEKSAGQIELYNQTLDFLQKNKEFLSTQEGDKVKQDLLALQSYMNCQKLYFNDNKTGNYKTRQNAFSLLANMQLSLFNAGIMYSYGCKSAEDRTGLLNVNKEAMIHFAEQNGFYPDPVPTRSHVKENEFQAREIYNRQFQEFIPDLVYKTASAENTNQNSHGARGLQVPHKISKAMGLLAKGIFKKAEGVELTQIQKSVKDSGMEIDPKVTSYLIQYKRFQFNNTETEIKFDVTFQKINDQLAKLNKENFTGFNKVILEHHSKDEKSLQATINLVKDELKTLQNQVKKESEKKQSIIKNSFNFLKSNPDEPRVKKETNIINDRLKEKEQELKYLQELMKLQHGLALRYQYLHALNDDNRTIGILHHISHLESHEIAHEKELLNIVESGLGILAQSKNNCLKQFENLDRCKVEILKQEAKYGLLSVESKTNTQEPRALILERQIHYTSLAIEDLQKLSLSGSLKQTDRNQINFQITGLQNHLKDIIDEKAKVENIKSLRFSDITTAPPITRKRSNIEPPPLEPPSPPVSMEQRGFNPQPSWESANKNRFGQTNEILNESKINPVDQPIQQKGDVTIGTKHRENVQPTPKIKETAPVSGLRR